MYKVRKKYEGMMISKGSLTFTLYSVSPQQELERYHNILGSSYVYFEEPKSEVTSLPKTKTKNDSNK